MNYVPAKYTEVLVNLMNDTEVRPLINQALSTYPCYESTLLHEHIPNFIPTRTQINEGLLNHYKYREIGFETVGRFIDELEITMKEIMPRYNQMMFSMDLDYNVIYNVDYTKEITRNLESNSSSEGETSGTSNTSTEGSTTTEASSSGDNYGKRVISDTPQNSLGITNKQIDTIDYANSVEWTHDSNEGETSSDTSTTTTGSNTSSGTSNMQGNRVDDENIVERTTGNYGTVSAQSLIDDYRKLIVNIVEEIIEDQKIKDLFMTVY